MRKNGFEVTLPCGKARLVPGTLNEAIAVMPVKFGVPVEVRAVVAVVGDTTVLGKPAYEVL